MSFIQVDQEFVVETDTKVNNTGNYIMGETSENTIPLSNNNKRSMTLIIYFFYFIFLYFTSVKALQL